MILFTASPVLRTPIVAGLLALLAACKVVGPEYERPPVEVPAAYRYAPEAGASAATPAARWWQVFGDPVLDQLLAKVEVDNQSLRAVEARVRQAQAQVDGARAARSPTVVVGGDNDFGIVASWEVDLWGRIRRNIEANSAGAQASEADLAAARLSAQAMLAQSYFLLRAQDAGIKLLEEAVTAYERSAQITRNQYAVGVAARAEVVQADAQLGSTRAQLFDARLTRTQLENAIALLIGKAPADFTLAATAQPAAVPAAPSSLPSELLRRRPDIAAVERRMAVASAQIGVAEAAFYPSVNLSIGATVGNGLVGGARVEWPVFDAGLRRSKSAQALAAFDEAVANYRQTVLAGFREVEDNLAALKMLEQAAAAQSAAVDAARDSVRITNNQYRAGITNYLSVVVVQAAALNTERVALNLQARRQVASATLIKALGGDWRPDDGPIEARR